MRLHEDPDGIKYNGVEVEWAQHDASTFIQSAEEPVAGQLDEQLMVKIVRIIPFTWNILFGFPCITLRHRHRKCKSPWSSREDGKDSELCMVVINRVYTAYRQS